MTTFDWLTRRSRTEGQFRNSALTRRFQSTDRHDGEYRSVAALVAAATKATPDAVALRAGSASMTYRELMTEADLLAEQIAGVGVGPDIPVGICIERSFDQIVAILAVSRAGGAFLPLDPAWPQERLCKVLDDARAPVVIAAPASTGQLSGDGRIALSFERKSGRRLGSRRRADAEIGADNLAYIIYTSGSTGAPKGVEITHGNLFNLISWHREVFGVTPLDRASYLAGLGFDAMVWEIWPYLTAGACVLLPDEIVRTSPESLRQWLVKERISIAFVPTPLAETLITTAWPEETALRFLLTGGDTLHTWPIAGLPFAVVNNYGPTECTVVATSAVVSPGRGAGVLPPIGRPIASTQIHIRDELGRKLGAGQIGEIYIGGDSVGRGYRKQPELTAEKFVTDVSRPEKSGARLYRTGDLGCWLPDGEIAFHGRCDDQLKVRGHRVEPDEISAALDRHPLVAQSAVVGYGDWREKRLVAYIVPAAREKPGASELRDFLASCLPEYMLPSTFVSLASLPVTANGKLDKAALPPPASANSLPDAGYRVPDTAIERGLATIVAELLGIARVGADDNFFLLGGHSLLGTQLVLRVHEAFGAELTLRDLFEAQTVANLAAKIEQQIIEKLGSMSDDEALQWMAG